MKKKEDPVLICVDGWCSGNPGPGGWRCVVIDNLFQTKEVLVERKTKYITNNLAEFFAIIDAMRWAYNNRKEVIIYSDSATAMTWIMRKKVNTKVDIRKNDRIYPTILRSELFLKDKFPYITIKKWNTKLLGDIPADFGRK